MKYSILISAASWIGQCEFLADKRCTLVIDCGFSFTHVIPLLDGKIIQKGVIRYAFVIQLYDERWIYSKRKQCSSHLNLTPYVISCPFSESMLVGSRWQISWRNGSHIGSYKSVSLIIRRNHASLALISPPANMHTHDVFVVNSGNGGDLRDQRVQGGLVFCQSEFRPRYQN